MSNNVTEKGGKNSNGFDVCITIINGIFNLFKFEKIVCIVIFYILIRDAYFVSKLKDTADYNSMLIKQSILEKILNNDNMIIVILAAIIIVLIAIIFILIFNIRYIYKKEIERLVKERDEMLYNLKNGEFSSLKKHYPTEDE